MNHESALFRILAVATLVLMAATACGSTGEAAEDGSDIATADDSSPSTSSATDTATDTGATTDGSGDRTDQPSEAEAEAEPDAATTGDDAAADTDGPERLADYFQGGTAALLTQGGAGGLASFDQRSVVEEQRQIEQAIRTCMVQQGFEYNPDDSAGAGFQAFFDASADTVGLDAVDYAAREGFGISTSFDAIQVGVKTAIDTGGTDDANAEILDAMGDGERDAWFFALEGAAPEFDDQGRRLDPETGEPVQGAAALGASGGCRYEAQSAVRADFAQLAELADDLEDLDDRFDSDTRVLELRREWSACMAVDGWLFASEDEAREEIQSQFIPFVLVAFSGLGRGAPSELSEQQQSDLDALQNRERDVAVKSLECIGDSDVELDEIRQRYEAEFIATNRDALEALGGS